MTGHEVLYVGFDVSKSQARDCHCRARPQWGVRYLDEIAAAPGRFVRKLEKNISPALAGQAAFHQVHPVADPVRDCIVIEVVSRVMQACGRSVAKE